MACVLRGQLFSEEHVAFRKVVRDFAEHEIAPHAERWDREQVFPLEVVRSMGELGLFGLPFPRYCEAPQDHLWDVMLFTSGHALSPTHLRLIVHCRLINHALRLVSNGQVRQGVRE